MGTVVGSRIGDGMAESELHVHMFLPLQMRKCFPTLRHVPNYTSTPHVAHPPRHFLGRFSDRSRDNVIATDSKYLWLCTEGASSQERVSFEDGPLTKPSDVNCL